MSTYAGGFAPLRLHTAPGVLSVAPAVGAAAEAALRRARSVELVRLSHGVTVHGDMSGDFGAAYPGDTPRPDLTAVGVAAALEAAGVAVHVRDENATGGPMPPAAGVDVRLLKVQLATWRADLDAAAEMRRADPATPVVMYGATLSHVDADRSWVVLGDATRALADLYGSRDLAIGKAYRLFPLDRYRDEHGRLRAHLQASRGCDRTCLYCPYIRVHGRWSARSLDGLREDVAALAAVRVEAIQFRDQDFASDGEHAVAAAAAVAEGGGGRIAFSVEGNLDRFTHDVVARLAEAGCAEVIVGIESVDPVVLRTARRRVLGDTPERIAAVKRAGVPVRGLFMVGLPGDDWDRVLATVTTAIDLNLDGAQFNVYSPLPGERFGNAEVTRAEDFVPNSNNFRYRTCDAMTAMEVRLAAAWATQAFAAGRAGSADAAGYLGRIAARAEARRVPAGIAPAPA
ncbi:MAG TPA: radical SAM protein [Frankiaceae bacterium]|jgi:hypothetical protein|nr:radical SAM protein [Frankiaceae bacterium]